MDLLVPCASPTCDLDNARRMMLAAMRSGDLWLLAHCGDRLRIAARIHLTEH